MAIVPLLEIDLHIRNRMFPKVLITINNINGDLIMLHGLELLILSSGTGTCNFDMQKILTA